eukprot:5231994-Pleurochrysis_carterae.AAC.1
MPAPVVASMRCTLGISHSDAQSRKRGQKATPATSPWSGWFSTSHATPASCAARARSAVNAASRLCFC